MSNLQLNKNGIRVIQNNKKDSMKNHRKQRQLELHKLDFREFAEFVGYEQGIEIKIVVPALEPLIKAVLDDGWLFIRTSKGEIA